MEVVVKKEKYQANIFVRHVCTMRNGQVIPGMCIVFGAIKMGLDRVAGVGISVCSDLDNPNKKVGLQIALARLHMALAGGILEKKGIECYGAAWTQPPHDVITPSLDFVKMQTNRAKKRLLASNEFLIGLLNDGVCISGFVEYNDKERCIKKFRYLKYGTGDGYVPDNIMDMLMNEKERSDSDVLPEVSEMSEDFRD